MFGKFKKTPPFVTAIIPAAGASRRMGGGNKLLMELEGVPVLGRTLLALEHCEIIREIIIAASEDNIIAYAELGKVLGITKLTKVVKGGDTRQESVYKAALEADGRAKYLAVHDGARPLVTPDVVENACKAAFLHTCAAAGVKVHDTIKKVDRSDHVEQTVDREALRAMQTPQVADKNLLLAALKSAIDEGVTVTDECAALERIGARPVITEGSFENIKITTPVDLQFARAILEGRGQI